MSWHMTFILKTNAHTLIREETHTLVAAAEKRNVVAICEQQPSHIKCELGLLLLVLVLLPRSLAASTPATVMRPFKARKCLHFCTFLLSHYAKYICIVCRCFSSSFDAYVLPSSVVFRFVSSSQASLPRPNYFSIIFSYWGAHSDFGPDSLDVVVVESGLYCECVAVALALWLLASAFGYYAFMSCQVRFKTLHRCSSSRSSSS